MGTVRDHTQALPGAIPAPLADITDSQVHELLAARREF